MIEKRTETTTVDGNGLAHKPYRILMIAPTSFFFDYGCSVRILEEARILRKRGNEVTVCTYPNGQNVPGLTIRRTPNIPVLGRVEVGSSPHKIVLDVLLFWTVLLAALRRRPDIIHAHMHEGALIGLLVGRILRIPMVFDFQGSLTGEMMDHKFLRRASPFYRPLYWLETRLDRLSPILLTSSRNASQLLVTEFGCQPERVRTVPDCVDSRTFRPPDDTEQAILAERKASLRIPHDRKVVVYLGLLAHYQGTDALLEAVAHLSRRRDDVHFLIMGFPAVEYYQQMAQRLGVADHTTFTGRIPYRQAREYLALGDLAVAPKLSATEGSGKILNYMAMALPTVAFNTPVSHEYLGDLGIYATAGDPLSLAEAMAEGLANGASRQRGIRLRHLAKELYSWDHAAETILQSYHAVCHGQPA